MNTITSHHSLAKILTSLVGKEEELSLAKHVAQQLQGSGDEGEKAVLAQLLATLLSGCQDVKLLPHKSSSPKVPLLISTPYLEAP